MPPITIAASSYSAWQKHKEFWKSCERCPLHKERSNVVLLRGNIPADILFIGEAPGESENALGYPFVGPAGTLLDQIITDAWEKVLNPDGITDPPEPTRTFVGTAAGLNASRGVLGPRGYTSPKDAKRQPLQQQPTFAVTNIVACIPWTETNNLRPPNKGEAKECQPRLLEIIAIVAPSLIITLGSVAKQYLSTPSKMPYPITTGHLIHPSAILRNEGPRGNLDYKRSVLTLARLMESLA